MGVFGEWGAVMGVWDFSGRSGGGLIFKDIREGRFKGDRAGKEFLGSVGRFWVRGDRRGARAGKGGEFGISVSKEGEAGRGQRGVTPAICSLNSGSMQRWRPSRKQPLPGSNNGGGITVIGVPWPRPI